MNGETQSRVFIEKLGDNSYKVLIDGEDHTMGNLLAKTLLELPEVEIASYLKPHPLEDKVVVFVSLKNRETSVVDVLIKALEKILEKNQMFRDLYLKALKERGIVIEA
ncbi:MAG: RpoL/Rpb11 RNA polymerase subunit family protein [Acidilobaceae archaeon]